MVDVTPAEAGVQLNNTGCQPSAGMKNFMNFSARQQGQKDIVTNSRERSCRPFPTQNRPLQSSDIDDPFREGPLRKHQRISSTPVTSRHPRQRGRK